MLSPIEIKSKMSHAPPTRSALHDSNEKTRDGSRGYASRC